MRESGIVKRSFSFHNFIITNLNYVIWLVNFSSGYHYSASDTVCISVTSVRVKKKMAKVEVVKTAKACPKKFLTHSVT
jgi:hypothetical protein